MVTSFARAAVVLCLLAAFACASGPQTRTVGRMSGVPSSSTDSPTESPAGPSVGATTPARAGEPSLPCSESSPCTVDWLWYATANGGVVGGTLPDYADLFDPRTEDRWARARARVSVFTLHESDLHRQDRQVLDREVFPALVRWGLPVNLDTGVATWATCRSREARREGRERTLALLRRLRAAGVKVASVSLQSILSKAVPRRPEEFPNCRRGDYSMRERIRDAVDLAVFLRDNGFSDVRLGIVDALIAHEEPVREVERIYGRLAEELDAVSMPLSFVHFDHPYDHAHWRRSGWDPVARVTEHLQETLGVAAGIVLIGDEEDSEVGLREKVVGGWEELLAAGGKPRHLHVASWLRNPVTDRPLPARELPEDAPDPESPMTKNLLALVEAVAARDQPPRGKVGPVDPATGLVRGWAVDPDTAEFSSGVEIVLDGALVGRYRADGPPAEAAERAYPGGHGFVYRIDVPADGAAHTLRAYAQDSRGLSAPVELEGSPLSFTRTW